MGAGEPDRLGEFFAGPEPRIPRGWLEAEIWEGKRVPAGSFELSKTPSLSLWLRILRDQRRQFLLSDRSIAVRLLFDYLFDWRSNPDRPNIRAAAGR